MWPGRAWLTPHIYLKAQEAGVSRPWAPFTVPCALVLQRLAHTCSSPKDAPINAAELWTALQGCAPPGGHTQAGLAPQSASSWLSGISAHTDGAATRSPKTAETTVYGLWSYRTNHSARFLLPRWQHMQGKKATAALKTKEIKHLESAWFPDTKAGEVDTYILHPCILRLAPARPPLPGSGQTPVRGEPSRCPGRGLISLGCGDRGCTATSRHLPAHPPVLFTGWQAHWAQEGSFSFLRISIHTALLSAGRAAPALFATHAVSVTLSRQARKPMTENQCPRAGVRTVLTQSQLSEEVSHRPGPPYPKGHSISCCFFIIWQFSPTAALRSSNLDEAVLCPVKLSFQDVYLRSNTAASFLRTTLWKSVFSMGPLSYENVLSLTLTTTPFPLLKRT